jgi:hypothetical protein
MIHTTAIKKELRNLILFKFYSSTTFRDELQYIIAVHGP